MRRSLQNIFDSYTNVVVCLRHGVLICESECWQLKCCGIFCWCRSCVLDPYLFRVCCVQLCIAVCVFCVQCSVCWIPICSAPPTASTHRAGSVWQEGADLNTMPPGYPPPTPPVQTAPDQDLNALLTPTPNYHSIIFVPWLFQRSESGSLKMRNLKRTL